MILKEKMIRYWKSDTAGLEDSVGKIMFVVIGIAAVAAIGYFIWNMISGQANKATQNLDHLTNPGQGNEFAANPFG
ncbi:hypothetical protein [Ileibacterium valens]|uniref:hypothetical protein n=1 Tax=Ileibacterium valens TaxID=1862668 RepID=UPI00257033F7|nr:hypothetical protein [Ileibacterium valens]